MLGSASLTCLVFSVMMLTVGISIKYLLLFLFVAVCVLVNLLLSDTEEETKTETESSMVMSGVVAAVTGVAVCAGRTLTPMFASAVQTATMGSQIVVMSKDMG